ncbi:MAPEG family protein [Aliidiomarina soli]|uniref:MAPEG family protein n=1 Tax=Aliidiomarina soli TaxID=1928574 RepID=A0A432WEX4_9GAMM|nr:MAPEG family protein [Aliidiomarina soli]RUO32346.1 hypothetical protein CWE14_09350 [Aliidiomarina soli]
MIDLTDYRISLLAIGLLLLMVFVQWLIASGRKAREEGAIPGTAPKASDHHSFTFRAWRTHQNTLENLGTMLGASVLAIVVGVSPVLVAWLTWIMLLARVLHMVLYYAIATNTNPSPRSYFFMLAWVANLALLISALVALF